MRPALFFGPDYPCTTAGCEGGVIREGIAAPTLADAHVHANGLDEPQEDVRVNHVSVSTGGCARYSGADLDRIGALRGVPRRGRGDAQYRVILEGASPSGGALSLLAHEASEFRIATELEKARIPEETQAHRAIRTKIEAICAEYPPALRAGARLHVELERSLPAPSVPYSELEPGDYFVFAHSPEHMCLRSRGCFVALGDGSYAAPSLRAPVLRRTKREAAAWLAEQAD